MTSPYLQRPLRTLAEVTRGVKQSEDELLRAIRRCRELGQMDEASAARLTDLRQAELRGAA